MGLAEELDYNLPERNGFHGAIANLASTRSGSWLVYHLVPGLDRASLKATGGRGTVTEWFAGVPPIWLTSIGARTGQQRRTPLFGIPLDENIALIGTGVGQGPTPAWVRNLEANPSARVGFRDRAADVMARAANGDENQRAWSTGGQIYAGFPRYRPRVAHREVRVFVLEPA